jgi:hypothetical protein
MPLDCIPPLVNAISTQGTYLTYPLGLHCFPKIYQSYSYIININPPPFGEGPDLE